MPEHTSKRMSFTLEAELCQAANRVASAQGISFASMLRRLLCKHMTSCAKDYPEIFEKYPEALRSCKEGKCPTE